MYTYIEYSLLIFEKVVKKIQWGMKSSNKWDEAFTYRRRKLKVEAVKLLGKNMTKSLQPGLGDDFLHITAKVQETKVRKK